MMKKMIFLVFSCLHVCANDLTWGTPEQLSTMSVDASDPRVGMDASGNLVAVWIENGVVLSKTQLFGDSWSTPALTASGSGVSEVELIVDASGNATAIWNLSGVIQAASLPFGAMMWGTPVSLSSSGSSSPQIAVDSSGNLAAIWISNDIIQTADQPFGMSWSSSSDISFTSNPSDSPQIVISNNQTMVAVWHSTFNGVDGIFSSTTTLGSAWPTFPSLISDPTFSSKNPQIAINSQDMPLALWYRFDLSGANYSNVIVQAVFGNTDTTWNTPMDLSSPGIRDPNQLVIQVAFNSLDVPFTSWTNSYDPSSFDLEGTGFVNGAWLPTIHFDTADVYLHDQNALVSTNYAYGAFMSYDPVSTFPIIRAFKANTANTEVNFGNILAVSGGKSAYPRIDGRLMATGHTVGAVWQNYDGTNLIVQASIAQGVALPEPTSPTITQNVNDFGVFSEYYNTFSWTSSTPDSSSRWVIFRNGVFLIHLPVSSSSFIDHNVIQNAPVTYGVALQSQDGDMSPIASASFP
jgi:hypothetical protein